MPKEYPMTQQRLNELKRELEHIIDVEQPALAKRLQAAIRQGDLRENADYKDAKEAQGFLEGRILELKEIINGAVIVDEDSFKTYTVVEKGTDFEEVYKLVGTSDADPMEGKVSFDSPIGKALQNAKVGDEVVVSAPSGEFTLVVKDIS